jgi:hypothetical protein
MDGADLEAIASIEEMITNTLKLYDQQFQTLDHYEEMGEDVREMRTQARATLKSTIDSFRAAIEEIRIGTYNNIED